MVTFFVIVGAASHKMVLSLISYNVKVKNHYPESGLLLCVIKHIWIQVLNTMVRDGDEHSYCSFSNWHSIT